MQNDGALTAFADDLFDPSYTGHWTWLKPTHDKMSPLEDCLILVSLGDQKHVQDISSSSCNWSMM